MRDILLDNQLDIKDLGVDQVGGDSGIEQRYLRLMNTPRFYRPIVNPNLGTHLERKFWVATAHQMPGSGDPVFRVDEQLASFLVIGTFDSQRAFSELEKLKHDLVGDWPIWPHYLNAANSEIYALPTQVLGLLNRYKLDQSSAEKDWPVIKRCFLSDEGFWGSTAILRINDEGGSGKGKLVRVPESARFSSWDTAAQLYGLWAQCLFEPKEAGEFYQILIDKMFFHPRTGWWNQSVYRTKPEVSDFRMRAEMALLGVIVESFFDKYLASDRYKKLLSSPLWDSSDDLWNYSLSKGYDPQVDLKNACIDQLLDLYVRSLFEETRRPDVQEIPLVRSYL